MVLFENPDAAERIKHLGVEVFAQEEVEVAFQRLEPEGLVEEVQHGETCCCATQDKVWSREPQGLRWEWYRITDDAPDHLAAMFAAIIVFASRCSGIECNNRLRRPRVRSSDRDSNARREAPLSSAIVETDQSTPGLGHPLSL